MKKQSELRMGLKISMLVMVLVCGAMAAYSQTLGDVDGNGSVDIVDALKVAQYYVGLNPSGFNVAVADANCNGSVDIVDALTLAQLYVGIISSLPCSATAVPTAVSTTGPTTAPTAVTTTVPTTNPTTPPNTGTHLDNPYAGAVLYVNQDWAAQASAHGGAGIANVGTYVWIDRIAAISGGSGSCTFTSLTQHFDRAVAQGANAIQLVVYDMPNRDCSASASNGELLIAQDGVNRYKTEFIDPIVAIMANYPQLRIICSVESDSLPNLVTNLSVAKCAEANSTGAYVTCLRYAIDKINAVGPNTYIYIDIAHSGWLGWDSNFAPAMDLISNCIKGTVKGVNSIDGFLDNTANTLPYQEPFIPDGNATVGGQQIKSATFYEFNPYTCEKPYIDAFRAGMISRGFPSTIGMILDTGRNGWGGPNRPTAASTSTDVNTFVNASKIDRRSHRGNWCNQGTAGVGARPQANPASGFDAFVWVKPPGESDGQSQAGTDPCDPNKTLDQMCVPGGINTYCNCGNNGALAGGPAAGGWFQALFDALKANANPTF